MDIVVDSSVVLAWCLEDEKCDYADALLRELLRGIAAAVVPPHFLVEVANCLVTAEKRGRIEPDRAREFLADLGYVNWEHEFPSLSITRQMHQLAHLHKLSTYDAAYLEIAIRRSLPLATFDEDLRRAAGAHGVACPATR